MNVALLTYEKEVVEVIENVIGFKLETDENYAMFYTLDREYVVKEEDVCVYNRKNNNTLIYTIHNIYFVESGEV